MSGCRSCPSVVTFVKVTWALICTSFFLGLRLFLDCSTFGHNLLLALELTGCRRKVIRRRQGNLLLPGAPNCSAVPVREVSLLRRKVCVQGFEDTACHAPPPSCETPCGDTPSNQQVPPLPVHPFSFSSFSCIFCSLIPSSFLDFRTCTAKHSKTNLLVIIPTAREEQTLERAVARFLRKRHPSKKKTVVNESTLQQQTRI